MGRKNVKRFQWSNGLDTAVYKTYILLLTERTEFSPEHVTDLEEWIDEYTAQLPTLKNFILPVSCSYSSSSYPHLYVGSMFDDIHLVIVAGSYTSTSSLLYDSLHCPNIFSLKAFLFSSTPVLCPFALLPT